MSSRVAPLALLFFSLLLASPALAAGSVEFVEPRDRAMVLGAAEAALVVAPPAGATVVSVEVTVDGGPPKSRTAPPWTFSWDAGETGGNHVLRARAAFSDGSEARAQVRTSKLRIDDSTEVALVNVYAVAKDGKGRYVNDLERDEIRIFENGRPQAIDRFTRERKPLRFALVLDASFTMRGDRIEAAKKAALQFLEVMEPGDEGTVLAFSDTVRVLQGLTGDVAALRAAVQGVETQAGTALYDAVWKASEQLAAFEGRRAMILLSDGKDEAASGLEPGSLHTFEEATDRALREEVVIFAIGVGRSLAKDAKDLDENPRSEVRELDYYRRTPVVSILRGFTVATGGRAIFTSGPERLGKAFEEVAEDLRHQYAVAYVSDDRRHDGGWRQIVVRATRPGVEVTNRKGYFAPKDSVVR